MDAESQAKAVAQLDAAVANFDANATVEALYAGKILDGFDARLHKKFRFVKHDADCFDIIANAIDKLVAKLEAGVRIDDAVGFLWREMEFASLIEYRRRKRMNPTDPELLSGKPVGTVATDPKAAIQAARVLLPRIQGENARNVLDMILTAIEQGRHMLSNREIAESLQLSVDNARQLRLRAFVRLTDLAREQQLIGEGFSLPELDDDDELIVASDGDE